MTEQQREAYRELTDANDKLRKLQMAVTGGSLHLPKPVADKLGEARGAIIATLAEMDKLLVGVGRK